MPDENSDPHHRDTTRWIGRQVSFDHQPHGAPACRLVGVVEDARYIGPTARGQIPDWEISVRGKSGALLNVSLVESHASFTD